MDEARQIPWLTTSDFLWLTTIFERLWSSEYRKSAIYRESGEPRI